MPFEIGHTVGDYEIIDVISSSRRELLFKVKNKVAQRFECLKVLGQAVQSDPERVERFWREIKVHARLLHPNIVTFYHGTQLEGQLVMTTELVEGVTLAERLELGPLGVTQAVSTIGQVLSALAYAHSMNVMHREVTPGNIILTPDGRVKLANFEFAKSTYDTNLTQAGIPVGTLAYMSPEQVKGASSVDTRTDIYSTGIVLYEALTGRRPFDSKSEFEMMLAQVEKMPIPLMQVKPQLPIALDDVVMRAMAKDRDERFQSAEAFATALYSAAGSGQPAQPAQAPVFQAPAMAPPPPMPVMAGSGPSALEATLPGTAPYGGGAGYGAQPAAYAGGSGPAAEPLAYVRPDVDGGGGAPAPSASAAPPQPPLPDTADRPNQAMLWLFGVLVFLITLVIMLKILNG